MASEDQDKTEQPTPFRLEEARKRGEVAKSPELVGVAVMIGFAATVAITAGGIAEAAADATRATLQLAGARPQVSAAMWPWLGETWAPLGQALTPTLLALMVVAVACFNIVSTLVMAVNEKRSEIAILKTMGASPGQIRLTFVIQGMVNGVAGALLGALLGGLLSSKLTQILGAIEGVIGHRFLNPDIYFIDFLPTELHMQDVGIVTGAAILMSLVATLYPAWRASGLVPSRELGH